MKHILIVGNNWSWGESRTTVKYKVIHKGLEHYIKNDLNGNEKCKPILNIFTPTGLSQ